MLDDAQHVRARPNHCAANRRRRTNEPRVAELHREIALRFVQRFGIVQQLFEHRTRFLAAFLMKDHGEAQRFTRAWRHGNAVLEGAEDAAADALGQLRRYFSQMFVRLERTHAHAMQHDLFAHADNRRVRRQRSAPPALGAGLLVFRTDVIAFDGRVHFVLRLAVKALPH